MKKKILAILLCVVMVTGILPVYAFAQTNPAQQPTNTTPTDIADAFAYATNQTISDYTKFFNSNWFNISVYDNYIVKPLNIGALTRAVFWFVYFNGLTDSYSPAMLEYLVQNEKITVSQAEYIAELLVEMSQEERVWRYIVLDEESKTAVLVGVISAHSWGEYGDIVFPEEVDGYTMIAIADGFKNRRGYRTHGLYIPDTYRRIGQGFHFDDETLRYIRLPENLEFIGLGAFDGCWQLQYSQNYGYEQCMEFDEHLVKYVGEYCFGGGDYAQYLPDPYTIAIRPGTTLIKGQAFNNLDEEIRMIIIPEGVKNICQGAFIMCDGLRSIVLPSTVTEIGYQTFMAAGINAIYIPPTVTKIDPEGIGGISHSLDIYKHLSDLTVYGVSGSAAEEYANLYDDVYFVDINDMVYGDIDSDGIVTLNDYSTAKTVVVDNTVRLDGNAEILGDMNADRAIDAFDLFAIDKTVNNIS